MKRLLSVLAVLALVSPVLAQNGEGAAAAPAAREQDNMDDLWFFQDAVPTPTGMVDLRLSGGWQTASFPANNGHSSDDYIMTPALYWGFAENWEASINVPVWMGGGGDRDGYIKGNYDTNVGVMWRFLEQADGRPFDMALIGNFRIPTGYKSQGVDYEVRLAMTHTYDNDWRAHFNFWGNFVNGNNDNSQRARARAARAEFGPLGDFVLDDPYKAGRRSTQYGGNLGFDMPLCANGDVRMVVDYLARNSRTKGQNWWHILQAGWEWQMTDANRMGFSFFYNLDNSTDAPTSGAQLTLAYALLY